MKAMVTGRGVLRAIIGCTTITKSLTVAGTMISTQMIDD
jgi:hypothetical protein